MLLGNELIVTFESLICTSEKAWDLRISANNLANAIGLIAAFSVFIRSNRFLSENELLSTSSSVLFSASSMAKHVN